MHVNKRLLIIDRSTTWQLYSIAGQISSKSKNNNDIFNFFFSWFWRLTLIVVRKVYFIKLTKTTIHNSTCIFMFHVFSSYNAGNTFIVSDQGMSVIFITLDFQTNHSHFSHPLVLLKTNIEKSDLRENI